MVCGRERDERSVPEGGKVVPCKGESGSVYLVSGEVIYDSVGLYRLPVSHGGEILVGNRN